MPRFVQRLGLIVFGLMAGDAIAGVPAVTCPNVKEVRKLVKSCGDNSDYSDAARRCLDRYDAAIKKAQAALKVALEKVSSADRQSQSMEHAKAGYQEAIATLKALVASGKALQADVASYKNEVVLPEDFDGIGDTGFDPQVFLDNNSCYKDTQDLIASYSELIGLHAKELEISAKIAEALAAQTFHSETDLKAGAAAPKAAATKGVGAAPSNGKPAENGKSDITGTEKKKK